MARGASSSSCARRPAPPARRFALSTSAGSTPRSTAAPAALRNATGGRRSAGAARGRGVGGGVGRGRDGGGGPAGSRGGSLVPGQQFGQRRRQRGKRGDRQPRRPSDDGRGGRAERGGPGRSRRHPVQRKTGRRFRGHYTSACHAGQHESGRSGQHEPGRHDSGGRSFRGDPGGRAREVTRPHRQTRGPAPPLPALGGAEGAADGRRATGRRGGGCGGVTDDCR